MTRFRNPGQREAAWGRFYARKGLTAADALTSERPEYPESRLLQWRAKYEKVPLEAKVGGVKWSG